MSAPELGHDDYATIDVRGKIVIVFSGAPARFDNAVRAHYSSSFGKIQNAAAHGAAGLIMLNSREEAERAPWSRSVRQARLGAMHWLDEAGVSHDLSSAAPSP